MFHSARVFTFVYSIIKKIKYILNKRKPEIRLAENQSISTTCISQISSSEKRQSGSG